MKPWPLAAISLVLVVAFFLLREHWGHMLGLAPYLILLACLCFICFIIMADIATMGSAQSGSNDPSSSTHGWQHDRGDAAC